MRPAKNRKIQVTPRNSRLGNKANSWQAEGPDVDIESWPRWNLNNPEKARAFERGTRVNKKAEEILSGFDKVVEKTEAMPVTPDEKRRLIKEWLRSRLAEMTPTGTEVK